MYIYRAINELDEKIDPTKNGLIAKSIIDEVIYSDYELLLYSNFRKENNPLSQMTDKELNLIYREIRGNFNLDLHIPEIINIANMNQKIANDILRNVMLTNDEYFLSQFENILSTKNGHITNGSSIDYPWISFSTDLSLVRSYYEKQEKNIIVVVDSNIVNTFDNIGSDELIALDLSSREKIQENIEFMINADKTPTSIYYRGFNYTISDKEVIYYNKVPKEKIVAILNPLQYELLLNDLLTEEYYQLSAGEKYCWRFNILTEMKKMFQDNHNIINYILEKYYTENISFKKLSESGEYNQYELNEANRFILQKVKENQLLREKIKWKQKVKVNS